MGKLIDIKNISQLYEHVDGRIGLVNGIFNSLNSEQISYLEKAKQLVDILFVGVFSDSIAKRFFNSNQAIKTARDRARFVSALECIDYVYIEKNNKSNNSTLALHFNIDTLEKEPPSIHLKNNGLIRPILKEIYSSENENLSTLEIITYKKIKLEKIQMDDYRSIYNRLVKLSKNSNCMLRSVAALIAKNGLILSEAYNHTSKYMKCERTEPLADSKKNYDIRPQYPCSKNQFICRANHAEQIAIFKALNSGIQLENATLYVTTSPCLMCAHAIFLSGISKVISFTNHRIQDGVVYLKSNNIEYGFIDIQI